MAFMKLLATLPFIGILVGVPLFNQVQPLVLGMPLVLAWIVLWIVATSVIMGLVYRSDPANRRPGADPHDGNPRGHDPLGNHAPGDRLAVPRPADPAPVDRRPVGTHRTSALPGVDPRA